MRAALFAAALLSCLPRAQAAGSVAIATVLPPGYPLRAIAYPPYAVYPVEYDGLTEIGPDGTLAPALATGWRAETETKWVFTLRENVRFANGEPCTAEAVKTTFDHIRSWEGRGTSAYREIATVSKVEVRGPHTLVISTAVPDVMLPQKLVSIKILPPRHFAEVGVAGMEQAPIGTGPYMQVSRTTSTILLKRNPHAWRPGRVDEIKLVAVPDQTARIQALAAGQVTIALDVGLEGAEEIARSGARSIPFPTGSVDVIQFINTRLSPLQDKRVRLALNFAVNKRAIVEKLLGGKTTVATGFASRGTFGFDPAATEPFPYDPVKAKALLADAGYSKGFDLPIEVMQSIDPSPFQQVAADLRAVGVNVTLTNITITQYNAGYFENTWKGLAFYAGYNAMPSLDALAPMRLHSCLWQAAWYCDEAVAKMVREADQTFDRERRLQKTRDLLDVLRRDPPAILLYDAFKVSAVSARVRTFEAPFGFIHFESLDLAP